jgi:hypothetical protein
MISNKFFRRIILFIVSGTIFIPAFSQEADKGFGLVDTNYIESYPDEITGRLYSSIKYTRYRIWDGNYQKALVWDPNRRLIVGFGAHYGILGLNIGVPAPWVRSSEDESKYGKTNYLDLQSHLYLRNFTIDIYIQTYTGFYLSNPSEMLAGWEEGDPNLIREDMNLKSFGANLQYFFNGKKYSYKALYNQNEWQKRSAGSFIVGAGAYYIPTRGDSVFIPNNLKYPNYFEGDNFNESDIISLGPSAGYAHTFVIKKHFFIALSWIGGITLGGSSIKDIFNLDESRTGITWNFHSTLRTGIGYNSRRWFVGFSYLNLAVSNQAPVDKGWLKFDTGNIRFNIARRFTLKKQIKFLRPELW